MENTFGAKFLTIRKNIEKEKFSENTNMVFFVFSKTVLYIIITGSCSSRDLAEDCPLH